MSDENIQISVDDAELDAAIAKLDEALAKSEQLTGVAVAPRVSEYTLEEALGLPRPQVDVSDSEAKLADLEAKAAGVKADVDDTVSESEQKLEDVKAKFSESKAELGDVFDKEDGELRGLNYSLRRVTSQLPGIRDAYRMLESFKRIERFGLMDIGGITSVLFLALSIYRLVSTALDDQKRQAEEYQKMIMDARGFATKAQFDVWSRQQNRTLNSYRTGIIP